MSDAHPFLSWRVQLPFWVCTLIWGTTWIVIRDQLNTHVPPSWSVTYRFLVAGVAMFVIAAAMRQPLRLGMEGQKFALVFGLAQFVLNFNFVYRAEAYITSGLVALVFALLIVPNTLLSHIFLSHRATARFYVGAGVAIVGIALLFVQEFQGMKDDGHVALGIGLTLLGVLSASAANVLQATRRARTLPIASLLAWGMLWGTLINAAIAWATVGGPGFDLRPGYWLGTAYLGLFASALAFMAYFTVIRHVGPGPAAYSSIITPVIAMAISTVFEDYRWTILGVAGGLLTLAGLAIALMSKAGDKSG